MKFPILIALGLYWTFISLMFLVGAGSYNGFTDNGFSSDVDINASGFDDSEIDSGGFFTGLIGIFTAMGRFIGFVAFGITPVLTGTPQILFSAWETLLSILTIGFIISAFWDG